VFAHRLGPGVLAHSGAKDAEAPVLNLHFGCVLMIQKTDAMGKANPDGLALSHRVDCSRLRKAGIEKVACPSKGEALGKEPADLHRISISKPRVLSYEKGFPVRKRLPFRFSL
jgi:hypothetical protein